MKKLLLFVFITFGFSENLETLFKEKKFAKICKNRWSYITKFRYKNEKALSLVAYSCLKYNYITPALDVAKALVATKEGRDNAIYLSTLFLMKKLLISLIKDNKDISSIRLPVISDNSLGKVFYLVQKNGYGKEGEKIIVPDREYIYKISISADYNIIIETFKNGKQIKTEYYW